MTSISEINEFLRYNPYFKNLTDGQKLAIFNEVYSEIYQQRNEPVILNDLSIEPTVIRKISYFSPVNLNLSALREIDALIGDAEPLVSLPEAQRLLIYRIALREINLWRIILQNQEYKFNTGKDSPFIVSNRYEPSISGTANKVTITDYYNYYEPTLEFETIKRVEDSYDYSLIPGLTANVFVATEESFSFSYEPYLIFELMKLTSHALDVEYQPTLSFTTLVQTAISDLNINYIPTLTFELTVSPESYNFIFSSDFEPTLTLTLNVTK